MASSFTRAERSGNIFYRVTGLIRSGQLPWAERPLWYDVYVAHQPLEPHDWNVKHAKHDEPINYGCICNAAVALLLTHHPKHFIQKLKAIAEDVRKIFYNEDLVRAQFYKKYRGGVMNLENPKENLSQQFIKEFETVQSENKDIKLTQEELFRKTEERMKEAGVQLR